MLLPCIGIPFSLAPYDSRSVLAVKGPLAPLRALDRSGPLRADPGRSGPIRGDALFARGRRDSGRANGPEGNLSAITSRLSRSGGAKLPARAAAQRRRRGSALTRPFAEATSGVLGFLIW